MSYRFEYRVKRSDISGRWLAQCRKTPYSEWRSCYPKSYIYQSSASADCHKHARFCTERRETHYLGYL